MTDDNFNSIEINYDLADVCEDAHEYLLNECADKDSDLEALHKLLTDLHYKTFMFLTAARLFGMYTSGKGQPANNAIKDAVEGTADRNNELVQRLMQAAISESGGRQVATMSTFDQPTEQMH